MKTKNSVSKAEIIALTDGLLAVVSVFLPWFSASASAGAENVVSSISVNGLGSVSRAGMLLGLVGGKVGWEFQGIGVLALGLASIASGLFLGERLQSIAALSCGF